MIEELRSKIEGIRQEATRAMASLKDLQSFQDFKSQLLGKKGSLTEVLKSLSSLNPEERPLLGKLVNQVKTEIETQLKSVQLFLEEKARESKLAGKRIDVTLPGTLLPQGFRHPIAQVREEIESIFARLGFSVFLGPEVESDYYNFEALNFPEEHPARDMQDTFYIKTKNQELKTKNEFLLRTHTSPVQIRVMEKHKPPLYMIAPGAVYRHDDDVTHSPMFHQVEGLMVDNSITFGDLKGVLSHFCRTVFGKERKVRFRPSFFPFVEPGAEVDISCDLCKGKPHHLSGPRSGHFARGQVVGKGCRVCGGDGWLEILGAGMVHPAVFEKVGIDPKKFSGFAFGLGVERIAMLKYGMDDIRLFYQSDIRFLEQF